MHQSLFSVYQIYCMTICNKTALCPRGGVDMARKGLNEEFQFHRDIFDFIDKLDG